MSTVIQAVGLNNDGTYSPNTANTYTNTSSSVTDSVDDLDAAVKRNEVYNTDSGLTITKADSGTTISLGYIDAGTYGN